MKTLGIIGGIGPDSTIVYYRLITAACRERGIDPPVVIDSISLKHRLGLASDGARVPIPLVSAGRQVLVVR